MQRQLIAKGSVQKRLVLQLILVASILTVLFVLAVRLIGERIAQSGQDRTLLAAASSIVGSLYSEHGEVELDLPYSTFAMLDTSSEDSIFYRISNGGEVVTGYADLPAAAGVGTQNFDTTTYLREDVRVVTQRRSLEVDGIATPVEVTVAQTRQGYAGTVNRIQAVAWAVGLGFFLVATALCLVASRSALRPLNVVVSDIRTRGAEDLRPVEREVPAEIAPLIFALNGFILRLQASLNKAEDFITEAAHRIRTPMALMQTQGEIALQLAKTPRMRSAIREIIGAARESSRSASQLLDHATVAFRAENPQLEKVSLRDQVEFSAARFYPLAEMKRISLDLSGPSEDLVIRADPLILQSAIGNVLDNALKYSGADTRVRIRCERAGNMAAIRILDEGPGFDPEVARRATERFFRGEKTAATEGSGLGMKIVQDALDVHKGRIEISANEELGSCVSLLLPLHS